LPWRRPKPLCAGYLNEKYYPWVKRRRVYERRLDFSLKGVRRGGRRLASSREVAVGPRKKGLADSGKRGKWEKR